MPSSASLYRTFLATDEDGRRHVIRVLPGLRGTPTPDDPAGRIPGPKRIVLDGGGELERVERGRYIAPWGETFTSDDAEAP
jgi:hypothetical protein